MGGKIAAILGGIGILIGFGLILGNPSGTKQAGSSIDALLVDETKALQLR